MEKTGAEERDARVIGASIPRMSSGEAFADCGSTLASTLTAEDQTTSRSSGFLSEKNTDETEAPYPTGVKRSFIVLALCLGVLTMALDNAIITTAIPRITDEFQSLGDVSWYGASYLLATAALQLFFGRLYKLFPIKWVFLLAVSLFEIGSLVCGVAQSSITLVMGRVVAGCGAAGLFNGALMILAHTVPLEKRPVYHGCIGSMWGVAAAAGPMLGGLFTDKVNWRWCFLVNLPIGAVTIVVIAFFFPEPRRQITKGTPWRRFCSMDPLGTLVFIPGIILLFLALQLGGTASPWSSPRIVALVSISSVLLVAFIYIQYRQRDSATVPPRIWKKRTVWSSSLFAFSTGATYLVGVYFLPIWFQAVKGKSAVESGLLIMPLLLSVVALSVLAGWIVSWSGYYTPLMILGSILAAVGSGLFITIKPEITNSALVGFQLLVGAGIGCGLQQPLMAVQTVLHMDDISIGVSIVIFLQNVGAALSVALGQTVLANELVRGLGELVPNLSPSIVLETGATSIRDRIPEHALPGVTTAYNDALAKAFIVGTVTGVGSILASLAVEWRSVRDKHRLGSEA